MKEVFLAIVFLAVFGWVWTRLAWFVIGWVLDCFIDPEQEDAR